MASIAMAVSKLCGWSVYCRDDMSEEEAVALVAKAIRAGIFNDLGSGSNVDVCIIRKDGVDYRRNMEFLQVRCRFLLDMQSQCPACPLQACSHTSKLQQQLFCGDCTKSCPAWQDKTYSRAKPVQHAPGTAGRCIGLLQPPVTVVALYHDCLLPFNAQVKFVWRTSLFVAVPHLQMSFVRRCTTSSSWMLWRSSRGSRLMPWIRQLESKGTHCTAGYPNGTAVHSWCSSQAFHARHQ